MIEFGISIPITIALWFFFGRKGLNVMTEQEHKERYEHARKNLFATATRTDLDAEPNQLIRIGFWREADTRKIYEVWPRGRMQWNGTCARSDIQAADTVFAMVRYWDYGNGSESQMDTVPELPEEMNLRDRSAASKPTPGR